MLGAEPDLLEVHRATSGEVRQIAARSVFVLAWSPNGRFIAMVGDSEDRDVKPLSLLRLADEKHLPLTDGLTNVWSPSWPPDGRHLYFISNRGGGFDLWRQAIGDEGQPDGAPLQVTGGLQLRFAAISPDGKKLAYSLGRLYVANLWRVPILANRTATWTDAEQLTFDQAWVEWVDVSPDDTQLLITSDRSGNKDIWKLPAAGGPLEQLTTDPTPDWNTRWSPDGRQIAFYALRGGTRDIWVMRMSSPCPV